MVFVRETGYLFAATQQDISQQTSKEPLPVSANLYALFETHFPADRTAPFLETEDGGVVTYGDLATQVAAYALALSDLNGKPGDRVAAQIDKSFESVALYLACLKSGLIFLPLNPAYSSDEIAYFIADAEPCLFICAPGEEATIAGLSGDVAMTVLSLGVAGDGGFPDHADAFSGQPHATVARGPDDIAAILYTSGTTGRPKGAMISHDNLASNALSLVDIWGFEPGDVLLHALPIFHVHGLFVAINTVLLNGTSMLFLEKFDAAKVIEYLPRATLLMGVPTFYTRLLACQDFTRELCRDMRLFISGSAPLLEEVFAAFEARTGQRILERYGMTETGMNTSNPLIGERIAGTVGPPLPGVTVRVAGEDGAILAIGEIGVLQMKGPNVFKGYWRNPEKTAEEFTGDGWFITGDLATIDETGRVAIVGRAKDLIISGGMNIYPKEVETEIDALEGVIESAVIGVPHADFGEQVIAFVIGENDTLSEAGILDQLATCLARYKQPKEIRFIDALPRNAMGKVQKKILRDQIVKETPR